MCDSNINNQNLKKKVICPLVYQLEESLGLECRGGIHDTFSTIEFLKDNQWQECVRIAPKGYSIDQ